MPRMEIRGMDAAIREMEQLSQRSQTAAQMAVQEAAKLLAQRLSAAAPVDTGALRSSIKPGPVTYDAASGYSCQVKPVGNHPATGEPLAKIGNILEYGRSYGRTKKAGLGWFHPTVAASEAELLAKMQQIFERESGG